MGAKRTYPTQCEGRESQNVKCLGGGGDPPYIGKLRDLALTGFTHRKREHHIDPLYHSTLPQK